jgi:glycosyltransferase involved in cell wall biosynthesis
MYRINTELRRHAPAAVQFVSKTAEADLQILDVIGLGSFEYLKMPSHALLQHCFMTTETQDARYWLSRFRTARLVMSYLDLPSLTGVSDFSFYRAPWGVDGVVFRSFDVPRDLGILTTGYDPNGEAIFECFKAARRVNLPVVHVGGNFGPIGGVRYIENVTDEELATYYSRARYVSGLRRGEGFELPVLEGLVCGARPICFDTAGYRHWFGDHAVFVPECSPARLTDVLAGILGRAPVPVTTKERAAVLERFSWRTVFQEFWSRLLGAGG